MGACYHAYYTYTRTRVYSHGRVSQRGKTPSRENHAPISRRAPLHFLGSDFGRFLYVSTVAVRLLRVVHFFRLPAGCNIAHWNIGGDVSFEEMHRCSSVKYNKNPLEFRNLRRNVLEFLISFVCSIKIVLRLRFILWMLMVIFRLRVLFSLFQFWNWIICTWENQTTLLIVLFFFLPFLFAADMSIIVSRYWANGSLALIIVEI